MTRMKVLGFDVFETIFATVLQGPIEIKWVVDKICVRT
jgi:hypothetical protein